jgi:hypothetical protein
MASVLDFMYAIISALWVCVRICSKAVSIAFAYLEIIGRTVVQKESSLYYKKTVSIILRRFLILKKCYSIDSLFNDQSLTYPFGIQDIDAF